MDRKFPEKVTICEVVTRDGFQTAPFVKPHFVLIAAAAAVLLIDGRSAHRTARSKNHASMIFSHGQPYG